MQNSTKEWRKNCLRTDERRPSSSFSAPISSVPSFFKIMIGDFGKAMFVPPTFAQNLEGMVNKDIYLEDSLGSYWMVKLRMVDGSLAFQQGWHDFVSDHSLSPGEMVIFRHISTSLFTVQIYGTSGSEKLQFKAKETSNTNRRKRSRTEATPDILSLIKAQRNYEDSEAKNAASDKVSSKKHRAEKTFPCGLASSEMTSRNLPTSNGGKHAYSLEESPSRRPRNIASRRSGDSATFGSSGAERVEEASRNCPIILSDDEDLDTVFMTKNGSSPHVDKSERLLETSMKEHLINRKQDLAVHNTSTRRSMFATERKSSMACEDAVREQGVTVITPSKSAHPETSQSKNNASATSIAAANGENMPVQEKAVAVDYIKDGKTDLTACDKSKDNCLPASVRKFSAIDNDVVSKLEVIGTATISTVRPESSQCKMKSRDTKSVEAKEENLSDRCNRSEGHRTGSREDCIECEIRIQVEDSEAIVKHTLDIESVPVAGCSQERDIASENQMKNAKIKRDNISKPEKFQVNLDDMEFGRNSCGSSETGTPKFIEDEGKNQIVPKELVAKPVVNGEDIVYTAPEDAKEKAKLIVDVPIGLCAGNLESDVLNDCKGVTAETFFLDKNSREVPSGNPMLECSGEKQEDPCPAKIRTIYSNQSEGNLDPSQTGTVQEVNYIQSDGNLETNGYSSQDINYNQSEGNFENNPSQARAVRSSPLVMDDMFGFHKEQAQAGMGEGFPSGNVYMKLFN